MSKSLIGIVDSRAQAEGLVTGLQEQGFRSTDVSVLLPDTTGSRDFAHEHHTKAPEGAVAGAGTGGLLGGALGLLAGIGTLAIPGLGPFIAAGPLMATLSGAAAGAAVGGAAGALIGLGIPELEAKRYEGKLREGKVLIALAVRDDTDQDVAKRIFERHGAFDISSSKDASVPTSQHHHASR